METGIRDGMIRGTTTLQVTGQQQQQFRIPVQHDGQHQQHHGTEKQEGKKKIN